MCIWLREVDWLSWKILMSIRGQEDTDISCWEGELSSRMEWFSTFSCCPKIPKIGKFGCDRKASFSIFLNHRVPKNEYFLLPNLPFTLKNNRHLVKGNINFLSWSSFLALTKGFKDISPGAGFKNFFLFFLFFRLESNFLRTCAKLKMKFWNWGPKTIWHNFVFIHS